MLVAPALAKLQKTNQIVRCDKVADGVSWIKLSVDLFNNKKIKQIRSLPEGDSLIGIWLQILCLAGSINENGAVYFTKDLPYTEDMLAVEFDRPLNTMKLAIKTFVSFGMIEITDNVMCVTNWLKYQNGDGLNKIREQARIRQQRYREKVSEIKGNNQELLKEPDNVTLRNVTERDDVTLPSISVSKSTSSFSLLVPKVIKYLNERAGTKYRPNIKKTKDLIQARLNDGYTEEDFYTVIDKKVSEWIDSEMAKFLRPETLFSNKFESYLNQITNGKKQTTTSKLIDMIRRGEDDETGNAEGVIDADYFIPKFQN